jgi:hypothetical protein
MRGVLRFLPAAIGRRVPNSALAAAELQTTEDNKTQGLKPKIFLLI